jgi:hypothetical protein
MAPGFAEQLPEPGPAGPVPPFLWRQRDARGEGGRSGNSAPGLKTNQ